jgi:hypothetical protein
MRSCREASALIVRAQAEALPWSDRWALAVHLRLCKGCRRFDGQMRLMSQATQRWRQYSENDLEP